MLILLRISNWKYLNHALHLIPRNLHRNFHFHITMFQNLISFHSPMPLNIFIRFHRNISLCRVFIHFTINLYIFLHLYKNKFHHLLFIRLQSILHISLHFLICINLVLLDSLIKINLNIIVLLIYTGICLPLLWFRNENCLHTYLHLNNIIYLYHLLHRFTRNLKIYFHQ